MKRYENETNLLLGLAEYSMFYREVQPHLSFGYEMRSTEYKNAAGGGVQIVARYGRELCNLARKMGQRQSAVAIAETILN